MKDNERHIIFTPLAKINDSAEACADRSGYERKII